MKDRESLVEYGSPTKEFPPNVYAISLYTIGMHTRNTIFLYPLFVATHGFAHRFMNFAV